MVVLEDEIEKGKLENEPNLDNSEPKIDQKAKLVLEEIIESERKYVKTLNAIVEKLVTPALGRSDMFSADDVGTLFGNIVELRSIHTKFFKEISVCQTVSSLTRVIERLLPPMSIAYNQYCSNFPRATALFGDINQKPYHAATPNRPVISKPISKTASLCRSIQQPDGSFEPNSIRSSISFRAKFSPLRPGPEKRDRPGTHSRGTGLIRRHTIIGRSSASINLDLQTPGFLRRTFSPRKSIKSCHEPVVNGFNQPVKTPVNRQSAFLENCMARSELDDQLPLIAYLLEPVQRVMRYPLLLKGLRYYLEISRTNSGSKMINRSKMTLFQQIERFRLPKSWLLLRISHNRIKIRRKWRKLVRMDQPVPKWPQPRQPRPPRRSKARKNDAVSNLCDKLPKDFCVLGNRVSLKKTKFSKIISYFFLIHSEMF